MGAYIFIWFIIILTTICSGERKLRRYIFAFDFLVLAIFSAIRFNVGMDFQNYLRIYYSDITGVKEPGYMWINDFLKSNGLPVQLQIALYAFLTIGFAFKYIKDNSRDIFLSVVIFTFFSPFYLQSFNVIRQSLAIFIFAYATKYIKDRKWKKYLLCILLATIFGHISALIALPLYFVLGRKYSTRIKIIFIIVFVLSSREMLWLVMKTPYAFYMKRAEIVHRIPVLYLIEFVMCIFLSIVHRRNNGENIHRNINILYIALVSFCIFNSNTIVYEGMTRIAMYFLPCIIILIPSYVKSGIVNRKFKYAVCLIGLAMFFLLTISLHGEANRLVPYQTFLN